MEIVERLAAGNKKGEDTVKCPSCGKDMLYPQEVQCRHCFQYVKVCFVCYQTNAPTTAFAWRRVPNKSVNGMSDTFRGIR